MTEQLPTQRNAVQRAYDRNVARFRPGQGWANGSSCFRIIEGPINKPLWVLKDSYDDTEDLADDPPRDAYESVDRLSLRVDPLPPRDDTPEGGHWIDESCFPYLRLMHDPAEKAR